MLSKNKLFNFFSISFLFWIFINNLTQNYILSLLVLLLLIILFFNLYIYIKRFKYFIIFVTLGYIIWVIISTTNMLNIWNKENILNKYQNRQNNITFEIKEIYKIKEYSKEYIAKIIKVDNTIIDKDINAIIIIPFNFNLDKWDIIMSKTKIYKYKDFGNFEYKNYMLSKNIYFKSYVSYYSRVWKKEINLFTKMTLDFRQKILSIIKEIYPKQEAIFLWWILIWARENIPAKLKLHFNNSWLTHFIAVSWFNITILVIFLSFILKYFPMFLRVILITIFIWFFTFLVWDNAPVIRASIMWLIWYYTIVSGRQNNNLSIILLTGIIMTLISPLAINYDISLHLSFLAVLWIIYTQDLFNKLFHFLPSTFAIKEAFVLTLASLSFTLPIMIFNFWQISLLSPFANIAITWSIPLAMFFWFLSVIAYFIHPTLWVIIWFIDWILLKYDIFIVHFFWQLDFALIKFDFWVLSNYFEILYLSILTFIIIYFNSSNKIPKKYSKIKKDLISK